MSLLSIIKEVAPRLGITAPVSVIGTLDPQVLQMLRLLEQIGQDLTADYKWQALRRTAQWTSTATESQGTILSRTGADFKGIVNNTFWNLTLRRPVFGPVEDDAWQELKAFPPGGPFYQYRIAENLILLNPLPAANETYSFIWESLWWVLDTNGNPIGETFTDDTNLLAFNESMMKAGLESYWKREKGLPYADRHDQFLSMVETYKMKDGSKAMLSMDQPTQNIRPGIWVPAGNWPV